MMGPATGDEYRTAAAEGEARTRIRGSVFLAKAFPCTTTDRAADLLRAIRKEFHDATHHCSAYRLGPYGEHFRAQDDGEPAGSAGKPILAAIDRGGLTDVFVVVTRWFGGTKLGVGGLVRAYGGAAAEALSAAGVRTVTVRDPVLVVVPHALVGTVIGLAESMDGHLAGTNYGDRAELRLEIPRSRTADFRRLVADRTRGEAEFG